MSDTLTFEKMQACIRRVERMSRPAFNGRIFVTPFVPVKETGASFNDPGMAKNRSKRIWKKLRYGKRRRHVRPIIEYENLIVNGDLYVHPAVERSVRDRIRAA